MSVVKRKQWEIYNGAFMKQSSFIFFFSTHISYTRLEYVGECLFSIVGAGFMESRIIARYVKESVSLSCHGDRQIYETCTRRAVVAYANAKNPGEEKYS